MRKLWYRSLSIVAAAMMMGMTVFSGPVISYAAEPDEQVLAEGQGDETDDDGEDGEPKKIEETSALGETKDIEKSSVAEETREIDQAKKDSGNSKNDDPENVDATKNEANSNELTRMTVMSNPSADEKTYTEVSTEEELRAALGRGENVKLTSDIEISKGYIDILQDLDVDLNGNTVTIAQTTATFALKNNASMTFSNGAVQGSEFNNKDVDDTLPVFEVREGGNLTLKDVKVSNCSRAVDSEGGNLTLSDVSVSECNRAVNVKNSSLTIENSLFEKNYSKSNGGAISLSESSTFLAKGDNKFISNKSAGEGGAISFHTMAQEEVSLSGMTFEGNSSLYGGGDIWGVGGGAISMYSDTDLILDKENKNVFKNNYAEASGGAILFAGRKLIINGDFEDNIAKTCEGGAISIIGNFREGWGGNKAELVSGVFTGNKTGYYREENEDHEYEYHEYRDYQHWGGGAIFVSDTSDLKVPASTLITGNKAGGFGGGLAGCSTGRVFVFGDKDSTPIIFDNKGGDPDPDKIHTSGGHSAKHEDHTYAAENETFMNSGYDDYFCALNSVVSRKVFTGDITGSVDHAKIEDSDELLVASYVMGIRSQGGNADEVESLVVIKNNQSYTHGGGILCNGYLIVGDPDNERLSVGKSLELSAVKGLVDEDELEASLENLEFTFVLKDDQDKEVLSGKNDSDGNITFDGRLTFDKQNCVGDEASYTFTYYLSEKASDVLQVGGKTVVNDTSVYKIVVNVKKNPGTQNIGGYNFGIDKFEIDSINVSKAVNGQFVDVASSFDKTDESHAAVLKVTEGIKTFVNKLTVVTEDPEDPEDPEEDPDDPTQDPTPDEPTPDDPTPVTPNDPQISVTPDGGNPEVLGATRDGQVLGARRQGAVLGARRAGTADTNTAFFAVLRILAALSLMLVIMKDHLKREI